jgi:hypothetical protein
MRALERERIDELSTFPPQICRSRVGMQSSKSEKVRVAHDRVFVRWSCHLLKSFGLSAGSPGFFRRHTASSRAVVLVDLRGVEDPFHHKLSRSSRSVVKKGFQKGYLGRSGSFQGCSQVPVLPPCLLVQPVKLQVLPHPEFQICALVKE